MSENQNSIVEQIAALKSQFEGIKSETEKFIVSAKNLSDQGVDEAKDVLDSAKENWHSIVSTFEGSKIAKFFSKSKKSAAKVKNAKKTAKKVATQAKKTVGKAKKTVKKAGKSLGKKK
jgi:hypothetical protein